MGREPGWAGKQRFPKIQIGNVWTVGPAVNVVTTICEDQRARRIAPATSARDHRKVIVLYGTSATTMRRDRLIASSRLVPRLPVGPELC